VSRQHLDLGRSGEELAVKFLKENNYKILNRNYKTSLGEIDIIALDKDVLCFIEVKTRKQNRFGLPQEAVTSFKQKQISNCALSFLKAKKLLDKKARFDIVAVNCSDKACEVKLIKNAFYLEGRFSY